MDWTLFWGILYALIIASTVVVILLENRSPFKAIGWMLVLLLLPLLGLILYLFFGRDMHILSRKTYEQVNSAVMATIPAAPEAPKLDDSRPASHQLIRHLIAHQTGAPLVMADEIAILTNGFSKIESLLDDINHAQDHIHIEYYRFSSDRTGEVVAAALMKKAKEGVRVRLLYDHVGCFKTKRSFFNKLREAGVEAVPFLPVAFPTIARKMNYRNHRKIAVIDGKVGYLGGMNIADDYTYGNNLGLWRDTHFRLTGQAVNGLQTTFYYDWYIATAQVLPSKLFYRSEAIPAMDYLANTTDAYDSAPKVGEALTQTFFGGPADRFRTLNHVLCRALYSAKKKVVIHTPYFLPTDNLNKAIINISLSGVRVELMTPWVNDSPAVKLAARSYYRELLDAGVHIYQYTDGFLHSKLMTIDDEMAIIGSANMDFRSLEHNYEINTVVYDRRFTQELAQVMERDKKLHSTEIDARRWMKRSIWKRMPESVFRLFAPLF